MGSGVGENFVAKLEKEALGAGGGYVLHVHDDQTIWVLTGGGVS